MIALTVVAICILIGAVFVGVMHHENRRDDRREARRLRRDPWAGHGLAVDAATTMDLGIDMTRPAEIAHDKPPPDVWRQLEETSPAVPLLAAPTSGAGAPGTTAAAAEATTHDASPPASAPPPLPALIEGAHAIAAHPERYAFTEWLRDDVAEAGIQAGA